MPIPDRWSLKPASGLVHQDQFKTLVGGHPTTVLRFSESGARLVKDLLSGLPVDGKNRELATKLVSLSMASAVPPVGPPEPAIDIVIPTHNDQAGLDVTLASLENADLSFNVTIVDDFSTVPVKRDNPVGTVMRNGTNQGPGASRNRGATTGNAEFLCFIDAGVTVNENVLMGLANQLSDPSVAASAPRVRPSESPDCLLARYEDTNSPLDMGPSALSVAPLSPLSYLPSTCLMVRRNWFESIGGFNESFRFGEDVDLVWRLLKFGRIDYRPDLVVTHPNRVGLKEMAKQRFGYGTAAASLARAHGGQLAPMVLDKRTSWFIGSLLFPPAALALSASDVYRLAKNLDGRTSQPSALATKMVLTGRLATIKAVARSSVRPYWPLTLIVALLVPGKAKLRLTALVLALTIRRSSPLEETPLRLVDDLAYSSGVWWGAWKEKSVACLLPRRVN